MRRRWLLGALTGVLVLVLLPCYVHAKTYNRLGVLDRSEVRGSASPGSSGGPDQWGYIYVDSDPPTPQITYSWIDLQATGWTVDTIDGLADDNVVGPFPIGFEFPYYWYDVDEFYVGSNGYISFSDDMLEAAAFVQYPNTARPNDVLGVFTDDLEFGSPSAPQAIAYMATNPAADTCVLTYENVPFWASPVPTGNNTFQIVLSKADSTIRYQYYEQTGSSSSSTTRSVGWEDLVGHWGYSYLFGSNPPANDIHAGLAIAIYDTATAEPPFKDVAVVAVMTDNSGGFFTKAGEPLDIWADIGNVGNVTAANFDVRATVKSAGGSTILTNTQTVVLLNAGEIETVTFTTWTPTVDGVYTITVESLLAGDENAANDEVIVECHVITLPATFDYCDDIIESGTAWNGPGSGWANYFVPPQDSVRIARYEVYINSGTTCSNCLELYVCDDNAPGGLPGDTLAADILNYDGGSGWYGVDITPKVEITDGSGFYIFYVQTEDSNPYSGKDNSTPFSYQGWEYTGSFAPNRDLFTEDLGIRCVVEPWSVPDVLVTIDEFQQTTVRGAVGVVPPNASLDFGVNFRNTTASLVSTQWWIHAYRSTVPNPIFTLGPFNLILGAGQDITKIYGLPVPSGVPTTDTYTVYVRVGSYPNVMHQDSFPVEIRPRGQQ
jgi:hypothetical protein